MISESQGNQKSFPLLGVENCIAWTSSKDMLILYSYFPPAFLVIFGQEEQ